VVDSDSETGRFYLPLYHDLHNAPCLVVGAGNTAIRKIRWLLRAQARLTVVAPDVGEDVAALAAGGRITLLETEFRPQHITAELRLVVSATNDVDVNRVVSDTAQAQGVLVNCVDQPALCTFIFPAIVDRHPLIVAVSSMGAAPTLSRVVRGWIEQRLPPQLGRLGALAQAFREQVKTHIPTVPGRMQFWEQVFSGKPGQLALAGKTEEAAAAMRSLLQQPESEQGWVALVGAGPGDPELITLKALRLIQSADVLLYDKLANPALLEYARRDAEQVYVGKQGPKPGDSPDRPDNRSNQQGDINQRIIEFAQQGKNVVRLKGGDPFIYGRGGEEMEQAVAAGLEVIVVPGITAALGAASYAGIPLTYRNLSLSVRFVTGHRIENAINLDWPELTKKDQTLVIYMGLVGLETILQNMREHGCEDNRPAALIEHATLPEQRTIIGTVASLPARVAAAGINGPSVVIIGDVVARGEHSA